MSHDLLTDKPINKILAPIDFSEASEVALRRALHLAHRSGAKLTILHVWDAAGPGKGYIGQPYFEEKEHLAKVRGEIAATLARLWPGTFSGTCNTAVLEGVPADEIVEAAKDADLIVIATHGASGYKRFVLGSTVEKVIRHAPCSVLVVKDKSTASE